MTATFKLCLKKALTALEHDPKGRVHGNGFMQIDVSDSTRLHVWGDDRIPCQEVDTSFHNHRFGFNSTILHGFFHHQRVKLQENPEGAFQRYGVFAREGEDTGLKGTGEYFDLGKTFTEVFMPTQQYTIMPGEWHRTWANDLAVTLMSKFNTDSSVITSVLCPRDLEPDNDFNRHDDEHRTTCSAVIYDTYSALHETLVNLSSQE